MPFLRCTDLGATLWLSKPQRCSVVLLHVGESESCPTCKVKQALWVRASVYFLDPALLPSYSLCCTCYTPGSLKLPLTSAWMSCPLYLLGLILGPRNRRRANPCLSSDYLQGFPSLRSLPDPLRPGELCTSFLTQPQSPAQWVMGGFFFFLIGLATAGEGIVRSHCTKFIDSSSLPRLLSHFDFYRVMASRSGFSWQNYWYQWIHFKRRDCYSEPLAKPDWASFTMQRLCCVGAHPQNWRWLPNQSYSIIHL